MNRPTSAPATVREHLLTTHADLLDAVLACADAVADSWDGATTSDRAAVVDPFKRALDRAGVLNRLAAALAGAVDTLDEELPAQPVAAPPYVAITSVGPVLRATLDSERLVVTIHAFAVERDPTRYVRGPADPADALAVELRSR
ncbi:hypothetical protein [Halococcus salifodinae]|uniref:DUF7988 domain-containing protein n=1 Tax=Halococcus salifodinae DSM 8989 TaxID=1227456 RepID=M0MX39_9EURY|nr:hypothetical protein [Halococcus salifodinae]EMA49888.1 hypothetical protein C450_16485 [Halococcus salifodinae DSM 8989]